MQYFKIVGREPIKFVVEMELGACVEEWNFLAQCLKERGAYCFMHSSIFVRIRKKLRESF